MATRMDPQGLIESYEAVASASRALRSAATVGDWTRFAALQAECDAHIARARQTAALVTLPGSLRARRLELLRAILDDDAAIRAQLEPSFERLTAWLEPAARIDRPWFPRT